jgi:hypothetical protein
MRCTNGQPGHGVCASCVCVPSPWSTRNHRPCLKSLTWSRGTHNMASTDTQRLQETWSLHRREFGAGVDFLESATL